MAKKNINKPLWHPSLLFSWPVVAILYLCSLLSMAKKQSVGERLGRFLYRKLKGRSKVARTNIQLCFPELNKEQVEERVEQTFIACTRGLLETTHA